MQEEIEARFNCGVFSFEGRKMSDVSSLLKQFIRWGQFSHNMTLVLWSHYDCLASYPAFTVRGGARWRKERLVSAICACIKFSQKYGKPCYFGILPRNGHLQQQWWWVLISLGLTHNLHRRRIQWMEAMEKWTCGDCFTFYSVMLHYDVLIENNKFGCVIMGQ